MNQNRLVNLVFLFFIFASEIKGENLPFIYEYLPYPSEFIETDFRPDNLQIGVDGREYMMDTQSKTICVKEGKDIRWGGGFGFEDDEFITPVSLAYSNLSLFVLDQSQSKLTEFDSNLNLVTSFVLDINYPELILFNHLNETIIFSNSEHALFRYRFDFRAEETVIDINQYPQISGDIVNIYINNDGAIGLLTTNPDVVFLFNLSGRYSRSVIPLIDDPKWLFTVSGRWIVFNGSGSYYFLDPSDDIQSVPIHNIHFMTEKNSILYALSSKGYYKLYLKE